MCPARQVFSDRSGQAGYGEKDNGGQPEAPGEPLGRDAQGDDPDEGESKGVVHGVRGSTVGPGYPSPAGGGAQ